MIVRELVAKLGFNVDMSKLQRFDRAVKASRNNMRQLTDEVGNFGRGLRNVGLGLTAGLTLPIAFLSRSMVRSASEAEESAQKFGVVFRDIQNQADEVANSFSKNFGVARDEAKQLIGTTGDLLTGFGFTQDRALGLSKRVAELGADLASFNNVQGGAAEAIDRLTKGILGETENLKLLGIVVRQDTKEFKNRVAAIQASTGATLLQAKAEAIFQSAIEQSQNAIGDFARTSEGYANQVRILRARLRDLSVSFGVILLPTVNRFVGVLLKVTDRIDKLTPRTKKWVLVLAGAAAAIGPILLASGLLITVVSYLVNSFGILFSVLAKSKLVLFLLSTSFIGIIAAISLVSAAVLLLIDDFNVWRKNGDSVLGSLLGDFDVFAMRVRSIFEDVKRTFLAFWDFIRTGNDESLQEFLSAFDDTLNQIGNLVAAVGPRLIKALDRGVIAALEGLTDVITDRVDKLFNKLAEKGGAVGFFAKTLIKGTELKSALKGSSIPSTFGSIPTFPPSDIIGPTPGATRQNTNVTQNVTVELAPGTSEANRQAMESITKDIFDRNLKRVLNETVLASPKGEQ